MTSATRRAVWLFSGFITVSISIKSLTQIVSVQLVSAKGEDAWERISRMRICVHTELITLDTVEVGLRESSPLTVNAL